MLELAIKLILSAVVVVVALGSLRWIWSHQIDARATAGRLYDEAVQPAWVVTRDSKTLYMGGRPAARVIGGVKEQDRSILFEKLADAPEVRVGAVFEYQRHRVVVRRIGAVIGIRGHREFVWASRRRVASGNRFPGRLRPLLRTSGNLARFPDGQSQNPSPPC